MPRAPASSRPLSSDSTLDGLRSWSSNFGNSTYSETSSDHLTTTMTDPAGAITVSVEAYGRQVYTKRTHPGNVFGARPCPSTTRTAASPRRTPCTREERRLERLRR